MKFKTNIKCGGCIATVTPVLDQMVGAGNWSVDLADPLRILTIAQPKVSSEELKSSLSKVGYQAEEIKG
jgi:copper chaperone